MKTKLGKFLAKVANMLMGNTRLRKIGLEPNEGLQFACFYVSVLIAVLATIVLRAFNLDSLTWPLFFFGPLAIMIVGHQLYAHYMVRRHAEDLKRQRDERS